jgi:thioredoxin-like negative regulator of GroEL
MTYSIAQPLVDLFTSVYLLGAAENRTNDALQIIRLVRSVRPKSPEGAVVEACQLIEQRNLAVAREVLDEADSKQPPRAIVKAMLAYVHFLLHTGQWEIYARECMNMDADPQAIQVLDSIAHEVQRRSDPHGLLHSVLVEDAGATQGLSVPC